MFEILFENVSIIHHINIQKSQIVKYNKASD